MPPLAPGSAAAADESPEQGRAGAADRPANTKPEGGKGESAKADDLQGFDPRRSVTRHSLPLPGGALAYSATAEFLPLRDGAKEELAARMTGAGFVNVRWESLSLGVAAIHVGQRAEGREQRVSEGPSA